MQWNFFHPKRGLRKRKRPDRKVFFESLEARLPLTAEAESYLLAQSLDVSAIGGTVTGSIAWGDGTTSPATISNAPASSTLKIRFDYSLDTNNFFSTAERKNTLQAVADSITSKLTDTLLAIRPAGTDTWSAKFTNPSTGVVENKANLTIAQNEIVIFAGARNLGVAERALGDRGGYSVSSTSQTFVDTVRGRGQTGAYANPATDFGPWGGSISFDIDSPWHFGITPSGLDASEFDFASVSSHEIMHVLGFGLSDSWSNKVITTGFNGANAKAVYGGVVPLNDAMHWKIGTVINGRTPIMTSEIQNGVRNLPTRLDYAGLQDVGWQLSVPQVTAAGTHVYGDNGSFTANVTLNGSLYGSISYPFSVGITNVAPTFVNRSNATATANVPFSIVNIGQFTDPGFGSPLATPPKTETFNYSINWGDGTAINSGVATIDTLGNATTPTKGSFDGTHTYSSAGAFLVTMTVTDDDGGSKQQQFTINVNVPPKLTIAIDKTSIPEDAGVAAATLTVQREGLDTNVALVVSLSSSDTTELKLPASVTIPVGQSSVTVPIEAVDDTLLDGLIRVSLSAAAGTLASNVLAVDVLDREKITLTLNRNTFSENAGASAAILTVARSNTDRSLPLTVQLTSGDTTEASVPATVVIPANASSIDVGVTAVDDSLFDGTQELLLAAGASGYANATQSIFVTDYQPVSLLPQLLVLTEETAATQSTQVSIAIRSPAPAGGVTLKLAATPAGQLTLPATVTIPAGATQATFTVTAINDLLPERRQTIQIAATGTGVTAGSVDIAITDTDLPIWTNPANALDVDGSGSLDPLDVLTLINEINRNGSRALELGLGNQAPYYDTNANGFLEPLDILLVINELNRRS